MGVGLGWVCWVGLGKVSFWLGLGRLGMTVGFKFFFSWVFYWSIFVLEVFAIKWVVLQIFVLKWVGLYFSETKCVLKWYGLK